MRSQHLTRYIGTIILSCAVVGLFQILSVSAGSPKCGYNPDPRFKDNFEPIAKIELRPYIITGVDGKETDTPVVGGTVLFDATPRDGSGGNGKPTNSRNEPTSTFTGPATAVKMDCFQPKVKITGPGTVTVTISLDGVQGSASVTVGQKTPVTPGSPTSPGTTDEKYCAYKAKPTDTRYVCISSSVDDLNCENTSECKNKPCVRVEGTQCASGGPAFDTRFPPPTPNSKDLGVLIGNIFTWSIRIVGLVVFVMFMYSGFLWLYGAGGDPGKIKQAQDQMWNAVIGALLLFSAYIILNTINPDLVEQRNILPGLPPANGGGTPGSPTNPGAQPLPVTK